jgi:hypothetical protein
MLGRHAPAGQTSALDRLRPGGLDGRPDRVVVAAAGRLAAHAGARARGRLVRNFVVAARGGSRLAASDGTAFLAWETWETPTRVFLAEEAPDGTWTGTVVSPVTTRHQRLAAVAATGGKATVLMMTATRLYARTQP